MYWVTVNLIISKVRHFTLKVKSCSYLITRDLLEGKGSTLHYFNILYAGAPRNFKITDFSKVHNKAQNFGYSNYNVHL